jgi:pericentriolar material 1 protein
LLNTDYLRQRALYAIQEIVGKYMTDDKATQPTSNKSYELKLEDIESDSSLSTPPASETPFALNTLGDTIIKIEDPITPLKTGDSSDDTFISVLLDDKIKSIMSQVIALLKSFLNEECTESVIRDILQNVMSIVMSKENIKDNHLEKLFEKQLRLCLNAVIRKYGGQRLCDIGEDLLVDITEVLFNELSCYQLLKDDGNMICSPLKVEVKY